VQPSPETRDYAGGPADIGKLHRHFDSECRNSKLKHNSPFSPVNLADHKEDDFHFAEILAVLD
jgi:hypothetical protein